MFNIFNLFRKIYCSICGRKIKGKINYVPIAEDNDSSYTGTVCDECMNIVDDYKIGRR
jgi:ribosome-binding protein aMBF1 (putative translation factor)